LATKPNLKVDLRGRSKEDFNFFQDRRVRSFFYQLLTAGIVGWLAWYLISNTAQNLSARGMSTGFAFLGVSAGFNPGFKLIDYTPGIGTFGRIFLIGILNTLLISFLAIIFSTLLGFFVGVMRLSSNWLVAKVALAYVEVFRNVPLLIQIIFWYMGVFSVLPVIRKSIDLSFGAGWVVLNNRGLYISTPVFGDMFWMTAATLGLALVGAALFRRHARKVQDASGRQIRTLLPSLVAIVVLPLAVFLATGAPLSWNIPKIEGFNFVGGTSLPPSFLALLLSLSIYHAAHIAEAVRAGILSVHRGQSEAAFSIGLSPARVMSMVVIPQAMRAIVPPLISNWMNAVKNSSLAVAVGYSDVVSLFMSTALNTAGHAVEIVAMTMGFYMVVSLTISFFLNIYNKRVQLVER